MLIARLACFTLLLSLCSSRLFAQTLTLSSPIYDPNEKEPCINPMMISQSAQLFVVTIQAVSNNLEIECNVNWGKTFINIEKPSQNTKSSIRKILLAGVGDLGNKSDLIGKNIQAIKQALLGKECELLLYIQHDEFINDDSSHVYGRLHLNRCDIGFSVILNGFATYKKHLPYELDSFLQCQYSKAESNAKNANIGIWSSK